MLIITLHANLLLLALLARADGLGIVEYVTAAGGAAPKLAYRDVRPEVAEPPPGLPGLGLPPGLGLREVEVALPGLGLRGVVATADAAAGETVLRVPARLAFTARELGLPVSVPRAVALAAALVSERLVARQRPAGGGPPSERHHHIAALPREFALLGCAPASVQAEARALTAGDDDGAAEDAPPPPAVALALLRDALDGARQSRHDLRRHGLLLTEMKVSSS